MASRRRPRPSNTTERIDVAMATWLSEWSQLWGVADLAGQVRVSFDRRLRTTLGSCSPARRTIRLREDLSTGTRERLREVLCHEAAHLADSLTRNPARSPHGTDWSRLVIAAGYQPKVRLAETARASAAGDERPTYIHRCPVCQMKRVAKRPVARWRCAACVDDGLAGLLVISKESKAYT